VIATAAGTLWWREIVRFYRQPQRVAGALLTPLVFWLLIGAGLGRSFRPPGGPDQYLEYLFPGMIVLILLFTSIFSSFSIIEDRNEGFLQSVLVAPVRRSSVVLGKVLGGATLAAMQAGIFLTLGPTVGIRPPPAWLAGVAGLLALVAFGLTAMGFLIAWRMDSTQGFHAVMNLFLVPMWLLSGAFFPLKGAPEPLQWVMRFNPLTYGVEILQDALYGRSPSLPAVGVVAAFGLAMFAGACVAARRSISADWR
jgi:ABC-2 type transport system permease protein